MKRLSMSVMLMAAAVLAGCDTSNDGVGPAQRAGKAVDDAGAKVQAVVEQQVVKADAAAEHVRDKPKVAAAEASRNLDRATVKAGEKVEQAGEKLQEAAR
jgi:predicted small secreted protein